MKNTSKILKTLGRIFVFAIAINSVRSCASNAGPSSGDSILKGMTQERKIEIAAEQLTFIKCKQIQGKLLKENEDEALEILQAWGFKKEIMQDPAVHARADEMVREYGTCDLFKGVQKISDIRLKTTEDAEKLRSTLAPYEVEIVNTNSHAICMQKRGIWDVSKRDSELESKIGLLFEKHQITDNGYIELIGKTKGLIAWDSDNRVKNKNCHLTIDWSKRTASAASKDS